MMYSVRLHGALAQEYGGDTIEVCGNNVRDVFQGLVSRFGESFKQTILKGSWHITSGKREKDKLSEEDNFLSEDDVLLPQMSEELHIFPALVGAKSATWRIIIGVVLIVIAVVLVVYAGPIGEVVGEFAVAYLTGAVVAAGVAGVVGGISQLLAKNPSIGNYTDAATDQKQSFIFNGAINNTEQGVPVPLVFGEHLTGSTVISAGMDVHQL